MKNILLPTDFSVSSYNALLFAAQLLQRETCTFYLLNTFDTQTPLLIGGSETTKGKVLQHVLQLESQTGLNKVQHAIKTDLPNTRHIYKKIALANDLIPTILKILPYKNIDLLMLGTKGSEVKKIFRSNTINKIIQAVHLCPILIIPSKIKFMKGLNIGFPTDLMHAFKTEEFEFLKEITQHHNATLKILHITNKLFPNDLQNQHLKHLQHFFKDVKPVFETVPANNKKSKIIADFISKEKINFIVMINNKNKFFAQMIANSVINKMAGRSKIPFLIIPQEIT